MSFYDDVGEFHAKFGLPVASVNGRKLCKEVPYYESDERLGFIQEEFNELRNAFMVGGLPEQLDALVDLVWVVLGTAHYLGAPFEAAWAEVKRANMEKLKVDFDPNKPYRRQGALIKPQGWEPPDIEGIIRVHNGG